MVIAVLKVLSGEDVCWHHCHIERESYIHGVLNLHEIKKQIAQFVCKLRDESNEPNQVMIATVPSTVHIC